MKDGGCSRCPWRHWERDKPAIWKDLDIYLPQGKKLNWMTLQGQASAENVSKIPFFPQDRVQIPKPFITCPVFLLSPSLHNTLASLSSRRPEIPMVPTTPPHWLSLLSRQPLPKPGETPMLPGQGAAWVPFGPPWGSRPPVLAWDPAPVLTASCPGLCNSTWAASRKAVVSCGNKMLNKHHSSHHQSTASFLSSVAPFKRVQSQSHHFFVKTFKN